MERDGIVGINIFRDNFDILATAYKALEISYIEIVILAACNLSSLLYIQMMENGHGKFVWQFICRRKENG